MEWDALLSKKRPGTDFGEADLTNYDAIIRSTLFRRLQDKAQVFPLDNDDYVRTRLTHSLEVSAIGKELGRRVFSALQARHVDPWFDTHGADEFSDVLLCAGLIHDIGNPPFGHFGEYAIREWFQTHLSDLFVGEKRVTDLLTSWQLQDLYFFEGNAQSLRLLSKTPYLGENRGFHLSCSVLGAIMKYPISAEDLAAGNNPKNYRKIGYYYSEKDLFTDLCNTLGLEGARHPISYLLEAADDIAYRTSDLEDAVVKKVITFQQITAAFQRFSQEEGVDVSVRHHMDRLEQYYREEVAHENRKPELTAVQRWSRYIQDVMIRDAVHMFLQNYDSLMAGTMDGDLFDGTPSSDVIRAIAAVSEELIYTSSIKTVPELFGRRVIHSLLDQFVPAAILYDSGEPISFIQRRTMDTISAFYKSMYQQESQGKSDSEKLYLRLLLITDYISGMTDSYAKRLYQELFV